MIQNVSITEKGDERNPPEGDTLRLSMPDGGTLRLDFVDSNGEVVYAFEARQQDIGNSLIFLSNTLALDEGTIAPEVPTGAFHANDLAHG